MQSPLPAHAERTLPLPSPTVRSFPVQLSSTPRGARLARLLAVQQAEDWGLAHGTRLSDALATIVAELAANAVTHGRSPGRDFRFRLTLAHPTLLIEVSDTRPNRVPPPTPTRGDGYGLLLVDSFADTWGCHVCDALIKTVWAQLTLPYGPAR